MSDLLVEHCRKLLRLGTGYGSAIELDVYNEETINGEDWMRDLAVFVKSADVVEREKSNV